MITTKGEYPLKQQLRAISIDEFFTAKTAREKRSIEMTEATGEIFRRGGKTSPTGEQDISDGEASKISNSGLVPFSSKFTNSSAEKTSSPQLANTTSKTTSSSLALNSSDGSKPPASFERWCVDPYAKFCTHICIYYYLFLSIVDYIVTFIQICKALFPWSVFRRSTSVVGNPLSVGMRPAAPFPRRRPNLQQPVGTVLRSPSIDSLSLMSEQVSTFSRNGRAISQTFEQQRSSAVPRLELMRLQKIYAETRTMRKGLKDPFPMVCVRRSTSVVEDLLSVGIRPAESFLRRRHNLQQPVGTALSSPSVDSLPLMSEHLSAFARNSRATPQTFEHQRLEIMHLRASNSETWTMGTGSLSPVPIVHMCRSTSVVEDLLSVGIRPAAPFPRRRHNLQHPDGRKGVSKQATPKHGSTAGEKTFSGKQCRNTDPRWKEKHPRASNAETRTHDGRKGVFEQATPKHHFKMGEKASSSKQRRNTDPRREERRPRASNAETRIHDGRKSIFEQATPKHGATTGKKASSSKQPRNTDRGKRA